MKAIARDTYGPADGLELREIERPEIGDDEVLVRVHAAGVDRGRLAPHGRPAVPDPPRGLRAAGAQEPGPGIGRGRGRRGGRQRGDAGPSRATRSSASAEGTFAEYARAPEAKLAPKPANLSFEQAAAVGISGTTALQALRDHAQVKAGQTVLIIGASGGVGTYAVQLAKVFGAEVTAVCSTAKVELVRSLGADHVLDYTREDFSTSGLRYDVILDIGGNASLARLRQALAPEGTLVIAGGETSGRWLGGTDRQIRALVLSRFIGQTLKTFVAKENHEDLLVLKELIEAGKVTPAIDRAYPLAEAPDAISYLVQGRARGKVVITV